MIRMTPRMNSNSRARNPASEIGRLTRFARGPRIAFLVLAVAACSSSTGPGETGSVSIAFRAVDGGDASASLTPRSPSVSLSSVPVVVEGSNGTLTIDEVWLIVDELKLEATQGACDEGEEVVDDDESDAGGAEGDESCGKFEASPHLLSLLLDVSGEEEEVAASGTVAAAQFNHLKFEVKAPRDDAALQEQLATQFAGQWPDDAAGLIVGSFSDGQGTTSFQAFFGGEVRVELEIEGGVATSTDAVPHVVVLLDPAAWFTNPDGTATNLALFDWETTQQVFDLEVKLLDGFTKIEVE